MPSTSQEHPSWDRLYQMAEAQEGYVTTAQAREAGYSSPLINHHVRHGRLGRVLRGVYRLRHFPPGEHEDLVVAWLWSGREGVFSHESALVLHQLSDALPVGKHLSVPLAWKARRLRLPKGVQLYYADVREDQQTWVGPVPVTRPLRTIVDCAKAKADPQLIEQALEQGLARGLYGRGELSQALEDEDLDELLPLLRRRGRRG